MHLLISGAVGKEEGSNTSDMTIDYVDFGQVPKIELPDPSEVFNATKEIESAVQSAAKLPNDKSSDFGARRAGEQVLGSAADRLLGEIAAVPPAQVARSPEMVSASSR